MAHLQYLVFDNENIPMPASYSVSLSDVEADSGGVTEAGTTQRDVVREGVVQIGVTSDLTITPRVMAAQGSYSGSAASSGDLISGINTALNTALAGGGAAGDIVIPVYIGGDMIDEIVVTAQQRMNLRSGGR